VIPATIRFVRVPSHPSAVHAIRSPYFERFFLPAVGPSGVLLFRFADELLTFSGGRDQVMPAAEVAESIGIGPSRLLGALDRGAQMLRLQVTQEAGECRLSVPSHVVTLVPGMTRKWTPTVRALHDLAAPPPVRA
jgi:hypothetical protein